ncbi:carboxy-terminal kinesin 2-like [Amblyraja radiata]|uniref:carboxy-terminal kinesin 2-like n=1 Tax=Amblyraja radiata TaxID=386614 RepID=UPI0014029A1C|nr:carboxy-terminal kinesin 2-like [Amblyraja radiata]
MEGPDELTCETKGIIPRAVDQIFVTARKLETMGWVYKFTASFLEIYNETIRDLLVTKSQTAVKYEIKQRSNKSARDQPGPTWSTSVSAQWRRYVLTPSNVTPCPAHRSGWAGFSMRTAEMLTMFLAL